MLWTCAVSAAAPSAAKPAQIDFKREILPILSDNCFACHGPDKNKRQSDLRLDTREGLFELLAKHTNKRAVVPGNLAESFAYQRIISSDPKEVMPPLSVPNLKLNAQEKDLIKRWIEEGASWSEHWAFVPPTRPEVPEVSDSAWPLSL